MTEFMISGIATKIINVDDVACGALEGKPFPEKGFEYLGSTICSRSFEKVIILAKPDIGEYVRLI